MIDDFHQPLHSTVVFSERFPEEDPGGNLAIIRISSKPVNLHWFWDGLLGRGVTPGEIGKDVQEIDEVMKNKDSEVKRALEAH